jgi:hypothetical protein
MPFSNWPKIYQADEAARMTAAYHLAAAQLHVDDYKFLPTDLAELIVSVAKNSALEASQIAANAVSELKGEADSTEV